MSFPDQSYDQPRSPIALILNGPSPDRLRRSGAGGSADEQLPLDFFLRRVAGAEGMYECVGDIIQVNLQPDKDPPFCHGSIWHLRGKLTIKGSLVSPGHHPLLRGQKSRNVRLEYNPETSTGKIFALD